MYVLERIEIQNMCGLSYTTLGKVVDLVIEQLYIGNDINKVIGDTFTCTVSISGREIRVETYVKDKDYLILMFVESKGVSDEDSR